MSWFRQALTGVKKFLPFSKRQDSVSRYEATLKTYKPKPTYKPDAYATFIASNVAAANRVYKKYALERAQWAKRPKVVIGELVRMCSGGRHAIYRSNIGPVRKPVELKYSK